MRNFYTVLRVAPKASEAEIKSAFRNMAKTCHPDVKPGDSEAEAAFQEVKRAYKFLSNPETRKVYDEFLASRRAVERRRFRRAAATMSVSFVLTAATVFVATIWIQHGGSASSGGPAAGPERGGTAEVVRSSPPAPGKNHGTGLAPPPAAAKAAGQRAEAVTERPTGP
jgi:DnaJ-class molecular chaperone